MKVIVLGSGVIGVANTYYLSQAGHEVVAVDRQPGPALETSFANAGDICPGYAGPWAGPGVPFKAIKWMLKKHSPLVLHPRLDPAMWRWLLGMLRQCTAAHYERNKARMFRLADYSRGCLQALRKETGITYDEGTRGTLHVFRDQHGVDGTATDRALLQRWGVPHALLDREGCLSMEPALSGAREKIAGGLHFPGDETGDCFKFTQALARSAGQRGADFRYRTLIHGLVTEGDRVLRLETDKGSLTGDAYVVAMGSYSPLLLRPLGIRLPVYPLKGYSVTVPIVDESAAPQSTLIDDYYKVAITRLGNRIRAAGTAELAGYDLDIGPSSRATLGHVLQALFPAGGDLGKGEYWAGLRPSTPDGPPVLGSTGYRNLFLNTGHGTLGWTMACGSGRVLTDILDGRAPDIELSGLTLERF